MLRKSYYLAAYTTRGASDPLLPPMTGYRHEKLFKQVGNQQWSHSTTTTLNAPSKQAHNEALYKLMHHTPRTSGFATNNSPPTKKRSKFAIKTSKPYDRGVSHRTLRSSLAKISTDRSSGSCHDPFTGIHLTPPSAIATGGKAL